MARFVILVRLSDSLLCTGRRSLDQETTGKIRSLTFQMLGALGLLLLLTVSRSIAQAPPNPNAGILMWSTNDFGIDLARSGINVNIPLRSKIGAIPFSSRLFGTSQAFEFTVGSGTGIVYTNTGIGGYSDPTAVTIFMTGTSGDCVGHPTETYTQYTLLGITDATGATHPLGTYNNPTWTLSSYCPVTPGPLVTTDGSGYTFVASSSGDYTIYDRSGLNWGGYCSLSNGVGACRVSGAVVDPDKNSISGLLSLGLSGSVTDTLDTAVLTANGSGGPITSYSYTDAQGTTQYYTYGYSSTNNLKTNFACPYWNDWSGNNATFTTSLTIPGGGQYSFSYEPTPNGNGFTNTNPPTYFTGRIAQIKFPSGGSISYAYSGGNNGFNCNSGVVPTITVTLNDNNGNSGIWTYVNSNSSTTNFTVTKTDPAGNQTVYNFSGEYQTQAATYQGGCPTTITGCNGGGTLLRTITTCYNSNFTSCVMPSTVPTLPISQTDVYTSFNGSSLSNLAEIKFDTAYGNVLEVKRYDFGAAVPPTGNPLSDTVISYGQSWNGTSCTSYPSGTYINNTPCYSHTMNSSLVDVAKTQITYSNTGHPTTTKRWVSGSSPGSWLTSSATYNSNGTVATSTDVNGALSTYYYNGTDGCSNLLRTSVVVTGTGLPSGGLTSSVEWNCNGAVPIQTEDPNSQPTTYTYNDPLWRLTGTTYPDGGATTTTFNTGSSSPWTASTSSLITSSTSVTNLMQYDGVGRAVYTELTSDPSGTDYTRTTYNNLGQIASVSQPYRSGGAVYSTQYSYDALGRVTQITTPNGQNKYLSYTSRATQLQQLPSYSDQITISQVNGLGQTVAVCEVTSKTQMGSTGTPSACGLDIAGTGFLTNYSYDPLGDLTEVSNSANTRTFTFDGLSRLTKAVEPELNMNAVYYAYDTQSAGDLYQRTAPAPNQTGSATVTTTYTHDAMHRLTQTNYSDATTPSVTLAYDQTSNWGQTLTNPKGRLTGRFTCSPGTSCGNSSSTSAGLTGDVFYYDSMGRAQADYQCTPSWCGKGFFTGTYSYNLLGQAVNSNDIQGGIVYINTYNSAAQLTQVYSSYLSPNEAGNVVSGILYNAAGQPTSDLLGNGIQESWSYDSANNQSSYTAGTNYSNSTTWVGNQLVMTATDSVNGNWSYSYDNFGRIGSSSCSSSSNVCPGKQAAVGFNYVYDQIGNRWQQNLTTGSGRSGQYTFNAYNHINTGGFAYDSAGNLTNDTFHTYTFDAEGRITKVDGGTTAFFAYNGAGFRVEQGVGTTDSVEYLYDLNGHEMAAAVPGTTNLSGGEIFANGRHWATFNGGAQFLHTDWVGTVRAVTNLAGTTTQQCTSLPFGDDASCTSSITAYQGINGSMLDTSDNLDHFLYRQYNSNEGRWLTPDPAGLAAVDPSNPQTWNRYAFVANNPATLIDPTGLDDCVEGDDCGGGGGGGGCDDWGICWGGGGSGGGGGWGGGGGGWSPPPGGPVGTAGQGIFSGQDCLACFPSGPSPLQIVRAVLSGNIWGALQEAGAAPSGGLDCTSGVCQVDPLMDANPANCKDQLCVWNVPPCQYTPCFKALPPIPSAYQCFASPGDAVPELPGAAPEQPDAPPGLPPPGGSGSGQSTVDGLGVILGYAANAFRCWVYKLSW
jgi:RHS repeat-associated protein